MAGYVLHLSEQENITLSAAVTRRLIDGGDGDAALLYLCLLKNRGSASPETLRAELKWDEARRSRAEARPCPHGTRQRPEAGGAHSLARPRAHRRAPRLFARGRRPQVRAGRELFRASARGRAQARPLSTPSVGKLLGLYEDLGLPADVLFLLVNHCIARHAAQYGAGRLPTMRRIEQEGYVWARKGLLSSTSAKRLPQRPPRARAEVPRLHGSPSARRTQALPERGEIPRRLGGHGLPRRDRRPRV